LRSVPSNVSVSAVADPLNASLGIDGPRRLALDEELAVAEVGRPQVTPVDVDGVVAGAAIDHALAERLEGLGRVDRVVPGVAVDVVAAVAAIDVVLTAEAVDAVVARAAADVVARVPRIARR
jgi:hypothetical protein